MSESNDKRILSVDDLLSLPDMDDLVEEVEIAGLGFVKLRGLSLEAHRNIRRACLKGDEMDMDEWEARLLAHCCIEPAITLEQARSLRRKSFAIGALLDQLLIISGITPTGGISQRAVDDAEASFRE